MASFEDNLQSIIDETSKVLAETHSRMNSDSFGNSEESAFGMRDSLLVKCRNAIENLHIEIEEERRKRREIENIYREVKSTNVSLEVKLKETTKKLTLANQDLEILSSEILEFKRETKQLEEKSKKQDLKQMSSTQSLMNQNSDLLNEIEDLKTKLAEKQDIMEEWTESVRMFEKKLEQLEEENKILRIECEEWQNKFKDISHKCDRLSAQAKISETLKSDLKRAQEDYEKYLIDERKIIQQKEEEMKMRYIDLEQKLKETFKDRENNLKKEMTETIEEIHRNMQLSSKEHVKTRNENISLKDENKTLIQEITLLKHELENHTQTFDSNQSNLQNLTEELRTKESDYKAEITKYKLNISKLTEEIETLKQLLDKSNDKTRRAEQRLEDLEVDLDSLSERYNQASSSNLSLIQELETLKEDYTIAIDREKCLKENFRQKEEAHKDYIADLIEENERNLESHIKNQLNILEKERISNKTEIENYKQIILKNEDTIRKILQERNKVEVSLKELEAFANSLKVSFKEQQMKSQESNIKSSDQISILTMELSRERERRLQDEVSISTLQQQVSDFQGKLLQESKLFKSEAMRKDQESLKLKKRYEERMKSFWDQNTKKWEMVASSVDEAIASLEWIGER